MLKIKEENIKIVSSQKWKVNTLLPLKNVLIEQQDCLLLWHMDKKIVMDGTKKNVSKFQSGYMSLPSLKQHRFLRTGGKIQEHSLFRIKIKSIRIFLNKNNYYVIALLMFYKHGKTTFFKVLSYVIYCFIIFL